MEETEEASLEGMEASKTKGGVFLHPNANGRFHPTVAGKVLAAKELKKTDLSRKQALKGWKLHKLKKNDLPATKVINLIPQV